MSTNREFREARFWIAILADNSREVEAGSGTSLSDEPILDLTLLRSANGRSTLALAGRSCVPWLTYG
jgi:hypothetical protein